MKIRVSEMALPTRFKLRVEEHVQAEFLQEVPQIPLLDGVVGPFSYGQVGWIPAWLSRKLQCRVLEGAEEKTPDEIYASLAKLDSGVILLEQFSRRDVERYRVLLTEYLDEVQRINPRFSTREELKEQHYANMM